jgi:hypothetical protein
MRRIATLLAVAVLCSGVSSIAAVIAEWNFNSVLEDGDSATGSSLASRGDATLTFTGGVNTSFGSVGGGATSDPALDNSQVRVSRLPAAGLNNKGAGVELTFSSKGYENLALSWDHYNSATASRYWRVQYSTDGSEWIDHELIVNTNASKWTRRTVSFAAVPTVNDRSPLRLRIVAEFELTALGSGVAGYVAVGESSNYGTAGTWWIDMVTISGRVLGAMNSVPMVTAPGDIVMEEGGESEPISFEISDAESSPEAMVVTAVSSNPAVITNLTLSGTGPSRSVVLHAGSVGQATITIRATDEEGHFADASFTVSVIPKESEEPVVGSFVALWNFNGVPADADSASGTLDAAVGRGELRVIGTESYSFGSVSQGRTSDSAAADNSMLRLAGFPAQGTSNKTTGVEITVSIVAMSNIGLVWDQYNSATASRFWRVQYTTNGIDFIDHARITNATASTWTRRRSVSFGDLSDAANNPAFAIRLVSEFGAEEEFVAVNDASNYSTAGTLWLDMIGITGEVQPIEIPNLGVALNSEGLVLSWPGAARDFVLELKDAIVEPWRAAELAPNESDGKFEVKMEVQGAARFFRLRKNLAP